MLDEKGLLIQALALGAEYRRPSRIPCMETDGPDAPLPRRLAPRTGLFFNRPTFRNGVRRSVIRLRPVLSSRVARAVSILPANRTTRDWRTTAASPTSVHRAALDYPPSFGAPRLEATRCHTSYGDTATSTTLTIPLQNGASCTRGMDGCAKLSSGRTRLWTSFISAV